MKAIVNTYLNIRSREPKLLLDNNITYFNPGDIVEIVETVIGENYKGNCVWYKLEEGSYAWSGGIEGTLPFKNNSTLFNTWNITEIWKKTRGKGVRIAILDCGFNLNNTSIKENKSTLMGDLFKCSHGTYMASIIGGSDLKNGYLGLAPEADFIYYSLGDINQLTAKKLLSCLESIGEVDIVNMSFTNDSSGFFIKNEDAKKIQRTIDAYMLDYKTVFVAATGNTPTYLNNQYPAKYKNVISVSGYSSNESLIDKNANIWNGTTLIAPYSRYFDKEVEGSSSIRNYFDFKEGDGLDGTSSSAAFTTGIFALLKSWVSQNEKKKLSSSDLIERLLTQTRAVTPMPSNKAYTTNFIDRDKFLKQF